MLSLETAKKLKETGLPWEYKQGDCCYKPGAYSGFTHSLQKGNGNIELVGEWGSASFYKPNEITRDFIFAPRLDQLLAEIEGRDATWDMNCGNLPNNVRRYRCSVTIGHWELNEFRRDAFMIFKDDSPGEATAQALLWILEQEKGAK